MAAALDPRYKKLTFLRIDKREAVWTALCNVFMDFYDRRLLAVCPKEFGKMEHYDIRKPVVKKQKRILLLCDIKSESTPDKSPPIHGAQAELNMHQKETPIAETEDPLMWWKLNNHHVPVLSIFCRQFFMYRQHLFLVKDYLVLQSIS